MPRRVTLLGRPGSLPFTQDDAGLHIQLPADHGDAAAYVFKIEGPH